MIMNGAVIKQGTITTFDGSHGTITPDQGVLCHFKKSELRYAGAAVGDRVKFIPVDKKGVWWAKAIQRA